MDIGCRAITKKFCNKALIALTKTVLSAISE